MTDIQTENGSYRELLPRTRHGRWMREEYEPGLVSVIVATYNQAGLLPESMDSVWKQTYRPIELLIIDDGSTDDTQKVVEEWGRKHGVSDEFRLRYFYQENAGLAAARNLGLIESHGEYLQFLDSDDLLLPERMDRIVCVFRESACDFVYTGFESFCAICGQTIRRRIPEAGGDPLELFCQGRLYVNSLLMAWSRMLIRKVGPLDEDLFVGEDNDYAIRVLLTSRRGRAIQDVLARARRACDNNLSDRWSTRKGHESRLRWETMLRDGIRSNNVSLAARRALAVRWHSAGVRAYPNFPDLGRRFGKLAAGLGCGPNGIMGMRFRSIWRMGRFACIVYLFLVRTKHRLWPRGDKVTHKCLNPSLFRKRRPI